MKTPAFWYQPPGFLSTLLAPLSLIYAAGRWLDVALHFPHLFGQPVICIGNAVAGGAGKTPTTLAIAALMKHEGITPHIVSRGYGGSEKAARQVHTMDTANLVGDEALLMASETPTWIAKDRKIGIGCALAAGAPLVLLDDGLQNNRIRAGLNILVVNGKSGFGNGQLLPAGPLREFPSLIRKRVQALVMIGDDAHNIAGQFSGKPVFKAHIESDLSNLDTNQNYVAFAGLARPEKFFDTCFTAGLKIVDHKSFADHAPYDASARAMLLAWAQQHQAKLLTTTKDAMRWPVEERAVLSILPIKLIFDTPQALRALIREKLDV